MVTVHEIAQEITRLDEQFAHLNTEREALRVASVAQGQESRTQRICFGPASTVSQPSSETKCWQGTKRGKGSAKEQAQKMIRRRSRATRDLAHVGGPRERLGRSPDRQWLRDRWTR